MQTTHLRPTGKRAIIQMVLTQPHSGLIHIPDQARPPATEGVVLRMGLPHEDLKEGDRVIVNQYGGSPMKIGGRDCKMVEYSEILAVLN